MGAKHGPNHTWPFTVVLNQGCNALIHIKMDYNYWKQHQARWWFFYLFLTITKCICQIMQSYGAHMTIPTLSGIIAWLFTERISHVLNWNFSVIPSATSYSINSQATLCLWIDSMYTPFSFDRAEQPLNLHNGKLPLTIHSVPLEYLRG